MKPLKDLLKAIYDACVCVYIVHRTSFRNNSLSLQGPPLNKKRKRTPEIKKKQCINACLDSSLSAVQILMGLKAKGIRMINYLKEKKKKPQTAKYDQNIALLKQN